MNIFDMIFNLLIRRVMQKNLVIKSDWMRLEAGDIAGCKVSFVVHFNYHRYFWKATSGKNTTKVMTDIILN